MDKMRINVPQGNKNKPALLESRVGNLQPILADDLLAKKKNIQIDDPGTPSFPPHAAHRFLDSQEEFHEIPGSAGGFHA